MFGETPVSRTRFPVIKIRGGEHVELKIRCRKVFGFSVHWLGKRSYICPDGGCAACGQFVGARWNGIVAVEQTYGVDNRRVVGLLELSDSAFGRLEFVRSLCGASDLLGLCVGLSRPRHKGSLKVDESAAGASVDSSCAEIRETQILDGIATLYGLPSCNQSMTSAQWVDLAADRSRAMIGRALATMQVR